MSGPLVTIGCAVYNGQATLARALEPVIGQDYENLEIIISDDCSTDGSPEIIREFARKDPRVRVLENTKNVGVTENFNQLAREARGKYFMWADQDDIRDRTFVSKAVAAMEADPAAVICHSHTGVFVGDPGELKYVVTLFGVEGVSNRVKRYFKFLVHYSDMVLYGLIRTKALRETQICRRDLGAGNALLFELLLKGKFIGLKEVLYYYSSRGVRNRPTVKQEYARTNPGKEMPFYYFPFLVLAKNQLLDIAHSGASVPEKAAMSALVTAHTSVVALTKLAYRTLAMPLGSLVPDSVTEFCDDIVEPKDNLIFLNGSERDEELFPKAWLLRGGD